MLFRNAVDYMLFRNAVDRMLFRNAVDYVLFRNAVDRMLFRTCPKGALNFNVPETESKVLCGNFYLNFHSFIHSL